MNESNIRKTDAAANKPQADGAEAPVKDTRRETRSGQLSLGVELLKKFRSVGDERLSLTQMLGLPDSTPAEMVKKAAIAAITDLEPLSLLINTPEGGQLYTAINNLARILGEKLAEFNQIDKVRRLRKDSSVVDFQPLVTALYQLQKKFPQYISDWHQAELLQTDFANGKNISEHSLAFQHPDVLEVSQAILKRLPTGEARIEKQKEYFFQNISNETDDLDNVIRMMEQKYREYGLINDLNILTNLLIRLREEDTTAELIQEQIAAIENPIIRQATKNLLPKAQAKANLDIARIRQDFNNELQKLMNHHDRNLSDLFNFLRDNFKDALADQVMEIEADILNQKDATQKIQAIPDIKVREAVRTLAQELAKKAVEQTAQEIKKLKNLVLQKRDVSELIQTLDNIINIPTSNPKVIEQAREYRTIIKIMVDRMNDVGTVDQLNTDFTTFKIAEQLKAVGVTDNDILGHLTTKLFNEKDFLREQIPQKEISKKVAEVISKLERVYKVDSFLAILLSNTESGNRETPIKNMYAVLRAAVAEFQTNGKKQFDRLRPSQIASFNPNMEPTWNRFSPKSSAEITLLEKAQEVFAKFKTEQIRDWQEIAEMDRQDLPDVLAQTLVKAIPFYVQKQFSETYNLATVLGKERFDKLVSNTTSQLQAEVSEAVSHLNLADHSMDDLEEDFNYVETDARLNPNAQTESTRARLKLTTTIFESKGTSAVHAVVGEMEKRLAEQTAAITQAVEFMKPSAWDKPQNFAVRAIPEHFDKFKRIDEETTDFQNRKIAEIKKSLIQVAMKRLIVADADRLNISEVTERKKIADLLNEEAAYLELTYDSTEELVKKAKLQAYNYLTDVVGYDKEAVEDSLDNLTVDENSQSLIEATSLIMNNPEGVVDILERHSMKDPDAVNAFITEQIKEASKNAAAYLKKIGIELKDKHERHPILSLHDRILEPADWLNIFATLANAKFDRGTLKHKYANLKEKVLKAPDFREVHKYGKSLR